MKVSFLTLAEKELDDAFVYYQDIEQGLGYRFVNEVTEAIERIKNYPSAYSVVGHYSRRCLIHKFPFALIFQQRSDEVLILAVSNLHRRPSYWYSRETGKR